MDMGNNRNRPQVGLGFDGSKSAGVGMSAVGNQPRAERVSYDSIEIQEWGNTRESTFSMDLD